MAHLATTDKAFPVKIANHKRLALLSAAILMLPACSLASLPGKYSQLEEQTVAELSPSNYVPRSAEEREAIQTQDLFAQTAFWSREYDLNPADLEAAVNLAANLRRMGNPGKSIEVAQHTRALYPRDVSLMTELGASLIADNQSREAMSIIDGALAQSPQNARLWSLKGAAFDQVEQFDSARQNYTRALSIAPNDPSILANVGLSYALEGDPKTAEIWLRRASALPGASPNVRQNLALVLGLQGKTEEAKRWASQDLDPAGASNNQEYIQSLRGPSAASAPARHTSSYRPQPTYRSNSAQGVPILETRVPQKRAEQYRQPAPSLNRVQPSGALQPRVYGGNQTPNYTAQAQVRPHASTGIQSKPASGYPGARLSVVGSPGSSAAVPRTASEAALAATRQNPQAQKASNQPSYGQPVQNFNQAPSVAPENVLDRLSQINTPKSLIARQQQAERAAQANARANAYAQQQRANYEAQRYAQQSRGNVHSLPAGSTQHPALPYGGQLPQASPQQPTYGSGTAGSPNYPVQRLQTYPTADTTQQATYRRR